MDQPPNEKHPDLAPRRTAQLALLEFLRHAERTAAPVTPAAIAKATGWKTTSARTYIGKGKLDDFLTARDDGSYEVHDTVGIADEEFIKRLSQSRAIQAFGSHLKNAIARQLLARARDNFLLAVELFNRPSLTNRSDAFLMLFGTAWEQLLKAEIAEVDEGNLYDGTAESGQRRRTIGFHEAMRRAFTDPKDPIRRNLAVIRDLRDDATHLLVPEVQAIATRYFQAGVGNFCDRFSAFAQVSALPDMAAGLLALALPYARPDFAGLARHYGNQGAVEIRHLVQRLEADAEQANDPKFAIRVEYRLTLDNRSTGAEIALTRKPGADVVGVIVEKPIDVEKGFPYRANELAAKLSEQTGAQWTVTDVLAVCDKERWRGDNNRYHYHVAKARTHIYSELCLAEMARRYREHPGWLDGCRDWRRHQERQARLERPLATRRRR